MPVQTARDQVVRAIGIVPDEPGSLGLIGRRGLVRLLAPRRHRTCTRKVKSPMSRYSERRDDGRHTMYRQLSRWADSGIIHKIGPGLHAATSWTSTPLPSAQTS